MILKENSELLQAFIEEANDLLIEIENSLMQINNGHDTPEVIARVFRSLHTIKGSSAMFGFTEISAFVHDLETTFDNIRQGKLKLSRGIIDLTLKALDRIHNLLTQKENDEEVNKRNSILNELKNITSAENPLETVDIADIAVNKTLKLDSEPSASTSVAVETFRIAFTPSREIFLRGIRLRPIFKELASLGEFTLTAELLNLPGLDDIDPESCYMKWEATLITDKGIGAVKNAFIFVNDYAQIEIDKDELIGIVKTDDDDKRSPVVFERRKTDAKTLRVKNEKLDQLVNLVGELVTLNARFAQEASQSRMPEFISISENFDRLISDLRDNTMSIRMVPVGELFNSFNRLVFELANKLNKKINLQIQGGGTELDKNMIEELRDPLMHLIRNCADHGIENLSDRINAGKPETGTISLSAEYSGSNVLIKISDDGSGLKKDVIKAKALASGLIDPSENDEDVIFSKIFEPGFSTAEKTTDVSGRGVGLDVVKRNIDKLRGSINIQSRKNEGSSIQLTIPLTLAIIDGFMFEIAGNLFIFNLSSVIECLDFDKTTQEITSGEFTINVRGEMISCLDLKKVLGIEGNKYVLPQIVITDVGGERVGFLVDHLIGKYQTVIKPITKSVNIKDIIVGATILGNGSIAFILDINRVVAYAAEISGNSLYKFNSIN